MTFHSVLYEKAGARPEKEPGEPPAFFPDLNLDQVVEGITTGKGEYHLEPFFYLSLGEPGAVEYRQEIFRDLERGDLLEGIKTFAQKMGAMREHLAQAEKLHYRYQKERWFLDAVEIYGRAVQGLAADLSRADLKARALLAFREYLEGYARSERFASLLAETKKLLAELASVQYCLLIKGLTVEVRKYGSEIDYSEKVEETFAKFKQGAVKDYQVSFSTWPDMNHVEGGILDLVARLYPEVFSDLDRYGRENRGYLDETIARFDREIQFYVAYLEFIAPFRSQGLKFCYPRVSDQDKAVCNYEGFDLALARKLAAEGSSIVCNDFYLQGRERIFVVTGPNQGGKTTFARTFGQLHYLASLGCPVPGREARLFLFDRLFTHFEREEAIENLRGKLQDDLIRIHQILSQATSNSMVILNEIFTSTTLQDAIFLSHKIMTKILALDLLGVWVTFVDEMASFGEQTVSTVSTVVPGNPALRTYKIIRRPADGLSYALSIAEKHGLTYEKLMERLGP